MKLIKFLPLLVHRVWVDVMEKKLILSKSYMFRILLHKFAFN